MTERIVLAYSGTLADSIAIRWLTEQREAEVVTMTLDLGAGFELQELHERALAIGAVRAHVLDTREEFAHDHILPALQAGAFGAGGHALAALAHPLIAQKALEIARFERASAVAYGSASTSGGGIASALRACDPAMRVVSAAGEWAMTAEDVPEYARVHGIPVPAAPVKKALNPSRDSADVEIAFERGVPVAINGVPMSLTELIESLSIIASEHGIASAADFAGTPALVVLQAAYGHVEQAARTTGLVRLRLASGIATPLELATPHS